MDGRVVVESYLIRPEPDWDEADWDEIAAEVHGIALEQLRREGRSAREVAERAAAVFRGRLLVSDAADADGVWLARLMEARPEWEAWRVVDILALAYGLSAESRMRLLAAVADESSVHRAGADARRLTQAWQVAFLQT